LLEEVSREHPCRAIVLRVDGETPETHLAAQVSTRCRTLTSGAKQLCGEQLTIEVSGPVPERASSAVEPLLVPDVPVFLWWKDIPHMEDALFTRLAAMADRVVLDSAASDHPHLDFLRLAHMLDEAREQLLVTDVNWGRLTSWRTLLASFWDVEDYAPHLARSNRVVVEYYPPAVAPDEIAPQCSLMIGWLASRLGWSVETSGAHVSKNVKRLVLRATDGRRIDVELQARAQESGCAGMLGCVTIEETATGSRFHVEYRREQKKLETRAQTGGELSVGRVLAYEARSEGKRLSSELTFITRDAVYEAAVASAARMLEALGAPET
jgi:glucose-6-phosphate dehydrogenase assembly protein OpcA